MAASSFLDHPGPLPLAHRGGGGEATENTMAAFQHAVGLGYRYLETDCQATRDGVALAFHDATLDRLCGRPGRLEDLPYAEVRTVLVDGKEPIPLLEDVLSAFPDRKINLDAKGANAVGPMLSAIRRTASVERVCVGSFHADHLRKVRVALGPDVCTSASPADVARWRLLSWAGPLGRGQSQCYQVPVRKYGVSFVTRRTVAAAHRQGRQVHVWTIDEAAEMDRLLDLGVDGIITDRPTVLKAVLQRRRQWFE